VRAGLGSRGCVRKREIQEAIEQFETLMAGCPKGGARHVTEEKFGACLNEDKSVPVLRRARQGFIAPCALVYTAYSDVDPQM
jgi:hypothetical protein